MAPASKAASTTTPSHFRMRATMRMTPSSALTRRPSSGRDPRAAAAPPAARPPTPDLPGSWRPRRWPLPAPAARLLARPRLRPGRAAVRAARPQPWCPGPASARPGPLLPPRSPACRAARWGARRARPGPRAPAAGLASGPPPHRAGPAAPAAGRRRAASRPPAACRRTPGRRRRGAPVPPAAGSRRRARSRRDAGKAAGSWLLLGGEAGGAQQAGQAPAGREQQHADARRTEAGDRGDLRVAASLDVREPQDLALPRREPGEQPAQVDPRRRIGRRRRALRRRRQRQEAAAPTPVVLQEVGGDAEQVTPQGLLALRPNR